MRTVPLCAAISSLSFAAVAAADVHAFDNAITSGPFCNDSSILRQSQDLSLLSSGSYASITGGAGDFSWSLERRVPRQRGCRAHAGEQREAGAQLQLVERVRRGRLLLQRRQHGTTKPGVMKIRLSDGTSFIRTVSNSTTFSGFVSDGANITSVEVSHGGSIGSQYFVATNGCNIGVVPAPGALALVGLAGLIARRRRA